MLPCGLGTLTPTLALAPTLTQQAAPDPPPCPDPDSDRATCEQAAAQATVDSGVFNYILNQEYLMAEFYSCASSGQVPESSQTCISALFAP